MDTLLLIHLLILIDFIILMRHEKSSNLFISTNALKTDDP